MELKSKEYWKAEIECQNEFLAKKLRKKLGKVFVKNIHTNLGFESKGDFNEMLELVTDLGALAISDATPHHLPHCGFTDSSQTLGKVCLLIWIVPVPSRAMAPLAL